MIINRTFRYLIFFLFWTQYCSAQTEFGLTIGLSYLDLNVIDSEARNTSFRYLTPLSISDRFTSFAGLNVKQTVFKKYHLNYRYSFFTKEFNFAINSNFLSPTPIAELDYSYNRLYSSRHALTFSMQFTERITAGMGGFYSIIGQDIFYKSSNYYVYPKRLTGYILQFGYNLNKLYFELRYSGAIGSGNNNTDSPDFKSINTLDFSLSYAFLQLGKKEKRKSKKDFDTIQ